MKSNYFKISDQAYLKFDYYEPAKKIESSVQTELNHHHIFVIDKSGSMYYEMKTVADRFKKLIRGLKEGDTVTIILFDHNVKEVFKMFQIIPGVQEFLKSDKAIEKEFVAGGLTGIAKPINHIAESDMIKMMLSWKKIPIKLYIMSDGYDNQSRGLKNILDAFSKIKTFIKIGNTHVEGFGEYYDKHLLTQIANHMDGIFVHTTDADDYVGNISDFAKARVADVRTNVKISDFGEFTFVLNLDDSNISMLSGDNSELEIPSDNFLIVSLLKRRPTDAKKISVLDENALKAAYSASIVASRNNKIDLGVEILSDVVKDKFFAEILDASITPNSFAIAENLILDAVKTSELEESKKDESDKIRFKEGKKKYLKNPNKESVSDLLFLIAQHEGLDGKGVLVKKPDVYNALSFRPYYPKKREDGTLLPKFKPYEEGVLWTRLTMNSLTFKEDSCNISIKFYQKGSVILDDSDVKKYNLQKEIKNISVVKNYAIFDSKGSFRFKDKKGVSVIFIKNITEDFYNKLREIGAIHYSKKYSADTEYRIRLDKFPIVNRKRLSEIKSVDYGNLDLQRKLLKTENSVINYFYNKYKPESKMENRFGEEEAIGAKELGIDGEGRFSSKEIKITKDILLKIFKKLNIKYEDHLPEFTTKKDKGKIKPFDKLTEKEILQLMVDTMLISSENAYSFKPNLANSDTAKNIAFNSISGLSALKENLILKKDFSEEFLTEQGVDFSAKKSDILAKHGKGLLTQDLKRELLEEFGIDIKTMSIEDVYLSKAGKNATSSITNHSEKLFLEHLKKYYSNVIKDGVEISDDKKLEFLTKWRNENKADLRDVEIAQFNIKLAYILGNKGFSDQEDRFNPKEVNLNASGKQYVFKPIVEESTIYNGSLTNLLERANIELFA